MSLSSWLVIAAILGGLFFVMWLVSRSERARQASQAQFEALVREVEQTRALLQDRLAGMDQAEEHYEDIHRLIDTATALLLDLYAGASSVEDFTAEFEAFKTEAALYLN